MKLTLALFLINAAVLIDAITPPTTSSTITTEVLATDTTPAETITDCSDPSDCCEGDCIKNMMGSVRGAVISQVDNLIIVVESEYLEPPPPCTEPDCGIDLPDLDDIFDDNCNCCDC